MSNYSNIIKFISINPTPQTLTFFAFNLSHADERKLLEAYNATPPPFLSFTSARSLRYSLNPGILNSLSKMSLLPHVSVIAIGPNIYAMFVN